MSVVLSKDQEKRLLDEIREEAVERYYRELVSNGGMNPVLTVTQAAGYLGVTTQTLRKLPVDSYDVTGSAAVSYRLADLDAYLDSKKVKGRGGWS